jgi:hypothetical protein
MRAEPLSFARLTERVVDLVAARPADTWTTVAIDGAPGAGGPELAGEVAAALPERGRSSLIISADDYLRPASLRFEYGREDADVFYDEWLDGKALLREVFDPLAPGGTGRVLPRFWNTATDRSARADYVQLAPGAVVFIEGALLLSRWLPFDVAVHLWLSPLALTRRTPPELAWTLPAYARYEAEADPSGAADLTVRMDDFRHPAVLYS